MQKTQVTRSNDHVVGQRVPAANTPGHIRQAIVIGGGLAGLAAARVLAGRFDQVTIIEHDRASSHDPQEREIRRQLFAHPRVYFWEADVIAVLTSADESAIVGVRVQSRDTHKVEKVHPDLVVDTRGRNITAAPQISAPARLTFVGVALLT